MTGLAAFPLYLITWGSTTKIINQLFECIFSCILHPQHHDLTTPAAQIIKFSSRYCQSIVCQQSTALTRSTSTPCRVSLQMAKDMGLSSSATIANSNSIVEDQRPPTPIQTRPPAALSGVSTPPRLRIGQERPHVSQSIVSQAFTSPRLLLLTLIDVEAVKKSVSITTCKNCATDFEQVWRAEAVVNALAVFFLIHPFHIATASIDIQHFIIN